MDKPKKGNLAADFVSSTAFAPTVVLSSLGTSLGLMVSGYIEYSLYAFWGIMGTSAVVSALQPKKQKNEREKKMYDSLLSNSKRLEGVILCARKHVNSDFPRGFNAIFSIDKSIKKSIAEVENVRAESNKILDALEDGDEMVGKSVLDVWYYNAQLTTTAYALASLIDDKNFHEELENEDLGLKSLKESYVFATDSYTHLQKSVLEKVEKNRVLQEQPLNHPIISAPSKPQTPHH